MNENTCNISVVTEEHVKDPKVKKDPTVYVKLKELAEITGLPAGLLRDLEKQGSIHCLPWGRVLYFHREAVLKELKEMSICG